MDGHHAIDVRILRHEVFIEELGDGATDVGGAIDAGNHAEIVAGGNTAVFADDAPERSRPGDVIDRLVIRTECVISLEVTPGQVVYMHMIARLDRLHRAADDLVVAAHRGTV